MTESPYFKDCERVHNRTLINRIKNCFECDSANRFKVEEVYRDPDFGYSCHYVIRITAGRNGSGKWDSYMKDMQKTFKALMNHNKGNFLNAWLIEWKNMCANDTSELFIGIRDEPLKFTPD